MSGFFIQGHFGSMGNFEVVAPSRARAGQLVHFWRDNDVSGFPWSGPTYFAGGVGAIDGLTLIESNFGSPGNLEVIAVANGQLNHYWRNSMGWNGPFIIPSSIGIVAGWPALIQGTFGVKGNFEVVVPSSSAGLVHFWRNNDDPSLPWGAPTTFGASFGKFAGVSLIQSNFGSPGNLEVIAEAGGQQYHFWRDSTGWNGPFIIPGIVAGIPGFIQGTFGVKGNFEAVAPLASGGLVHFWRNNDDPSLPWGAPTTFGLGVNFGAPSLIQGNFGSPGNLEVVVGTSFGGSAELMHFYRDSIGWHGPDIAETAF